MPLLASLTVREVMCREVESSSGESSMRGHQTDPVVFSDSSDWKHRLVSVVSRLLFCLAAGVLILSTARGEPAPDLTGVVADHADISSPRTTLDSLFNLTETFQALMDKEV
jgi:hypothetical protein